MSTKKKEAAGQLAGNLCALPRCSMAGSAERETAENGKTKNQWTIDQPTAENQQTGKRQDRSTAARENLRVGHN